MGRLVLSGAEVWGDGATVYTQVLSVRVLGVIDPLNCHYEQSEVIAESRGFCDCYPSGTLRERRSSSQ